MSTGRVSPKGHFRSVTMRRIFRSSHCFFILCILGGSDFIKLCSGRGGDFSGIVVGSSLTTKFSFAPPKAKLKGRLTGTQVMNCLDGNGHCSGTLLPREGGRLSRLVGQLSRRSGPMVIIMALGWGLCGFFLGM